MPEETRPFSHLEIDQVRRSASISVKQIVPLKSVCIMAGVARPSVYLARKSQAPTIRQPRAAVGGYCDAALVEQIRLVLATTSFFWAGPIERFGRNCGTAACVRAEGGRCD
jgi:hypothetical protein